MQQFGDSPREPLIVAIGAGVKGVERVPARSGDLPKPRAAGLIPAGATTRSKFNPML